MKKVFTIKNKRLILTPPLLVAGFFLWAAPSAQPVKYSFSDYKAGCKSSVKLTNDGIVCNNLTIPQLYRIAIREDMIVTANKILFNERVAKVFEKKYCYELVLHSRFKNDRFKIMKQNLKAKFPELTATIVGVSSAKFIKITHKKDGSLILPLN